MKRKLENYQVAAVKKEPTEMMYLPINFLGTNFDDEKSIYTWPYAINNYSRLPKEIGKATKSPPFTIGNYQFKIVIFLGGHTKILSDYTSICLQLCEPSEANIKFQLSILNLDGIKIFSDVKSVNKFGGQHNQIYGLTKFVKTSFLLDHLKSTNDQLIILCEIFDLDTSGSSYELEKLRDFKNYLNNGLYSDVKIVVHDINIIHAHKIILTCGNEVFAAMIENDMKESGDDSIHIDDFEYEIVRELIRFIYTGQVYKIEKIAKKLLIAANKYGVRQLVHGCEIYLCQLLSVTNVLEYLEFADYFNLIDLKKGAISFFTTYRKDVTKCDSFRTTIETLKPSLVADLMIDLSSF